uniref:palmitoyl-CoA hydrolase n=1 Tax=Neogobius melanostomus TaxID=47308 RepID=A0A8C6UM17_9GOBI
FIHQCTQTLVARRVKCLGQGHNDSGHLQEAGFKPLTFRSLPAHPGTEVTALDMFDDLFSLRPLWTQVKSFRSALESRLNRTKDGAHLICFSQGGVICRALLSVIQNHNIHSFIALSSPLAGQYGGTDYLKKIFPNTLKRDVYKLCYWKFGQGVSICQYWNDKYLKHSNFLALINGEKDHKDTDVWRKNFLRIKKLVLIGGPDDGVITPWQSRFGSHNTSQGHELNVTKVRNEKKWSSKGPEHTGLIHGYIRIFKPFFKIYFCDLKIMQSIESCYCFFALKIGFGS